jgi:phosphoribosyl 1,2-cyclic phosphate phosphodiesterase
LIITFLGTGTSQGIPVIACDCEVCQSIDYHDNRLRSAVHVQWDDLSIVIDTGPDFRQQMLRERIHKVDAVLYTHEHKDHTAGMDDIRSFNFKHDMEMPIYARQHVIEQLRREFAYVFAEKKYPGAPRITPHVIENAPFDIKGYHVLPIEVMHYQLPVFGFRLGDFTYITDAKTISDHEIDKIMGSKILVLNALQRQPHISHFTLDEALELASKIGAEQTYLTHASHNLGLHRNINEELPKGIAMAWDGLKVHC